MKRVTIEELLNWAFVHELPKGGGVEGLANGNSAWGTIVSLGTRVQTGRYPGGGENYFIEQGEPNPDALALGYAVRSLRNLDVVIADDWAPLADWPAMPQPELVEEAVARAKAHYFGRSVETRREAIVTLVAGTAALGREIEVSAEPSRVRMVERAGKPAWFVKRQMRDANGAMVMMEMEGRNPRTCRPYPGAYRRYELSTDPLGDILARLDYQVWIAALRGLERKIGKELVAHRLSPFERSMTPWLDRDVGGVELVAANVTSEKAA